MTVRRLLFTGVALGSLVLATHSVALAQGAHLFAVLVGGNEVSAAGQAGAGDPNGFGSATVIFRTTTEICFAILVTGIDNPTVAHIHEAIAGRNGAPVVNLTAPSTGNPGTESGCVVDVDAALVRRIRTTPSRFYINVHTTAFPNGALRGQLF